MCVFRSMHLAPDPYVVAAKITAQASVKAAPEAQQCTDLARPGHEYG